VQLCQEVVREGSRGSSGRHLLTVTVRVRRERSVWNMTVLRESMPREKQKKPEAARFENSEGNAAGRFPLQGTQRVNRGSEGGGKKGDFARRRAVKHENFVKQKRASTWR
jgi:hypothetical protein